MKMGRWWWRSSFSMAWVQPTRMPALACCTQMGRSPRSNSRRNIVLGGFTLLLVALSVLPRAAGAGARLGPPTTPRLVVPPMPAPAVSLAAASNTERNRQCSKG